jgi:predicted GH43/DUF377 family glycosyl hydrolase
LSELAHRSANNPLLTIFDLEPSDPRLEVACLLNPGVFRYQGKTFLLVRVAERPHSVADRLRLSISEGQGNFRVLDIAEDDPALIMNDPRVVRYAGQDYTTTLSHLRLMTTDDGIRFTVAPFAPLFANSELETLGIEDCRVVQIGTTYYLTFTQVSEHGVGVGLRTTDDWHTFGEPGMILPPHNKDCAIFEEKIGGRYFALHRPSSPEIGGNYIWIAESPDLIHWGKHRCIAHSRPGMWDSSRIGAGAAPIKTSAGWLALYHGASDKSRYCLGLLLLDLAEPWEVLARSSSPVMEPVAKYERIGFFGDVVFTNGHVVDGDCLTIYYGASDSVICSATFSICELLNSLGVDGSAA